MQTLHLYLARELLKTFLLTAVALTLLVVMGGGVANIFKGEGIGAEDMVKVFAFLTPVAVTLILPVAALFAAAITYGRSASDNEITACRAAGININRLLLSAALLGFVVTGTTYWAWNYMIPGLTREIENITRRDLPAIVDQQFQRAKPLIFGRYRIWASRCEIVDPGRIEGYDKEGHTYLLLTGVSFIEMEDEEIMRYGTAENTLIDFHHAEKAPLISVDLHEVHLFDAARGQYYDLARQSLPPFEFPLTMRRKTKFETLGRLLDFQKHPEKNPEVAIRIDAMTRELMNFYMYEHVVERLRDDGYFVLKGPGVEYEIHSQEGAQDPDDGRPVMRDVRVVEKTKAGSFVYTADTATIELRSAFERMRQVILVELIGNVEYSKLDDSAVEMTSAEDAETEPDDRVVRKPRETLKPVPFMNQPALKAKALAIDTGPLVAGELIKDLPRKQTRQSERLLEYIQKLKSEVRGEIHFRASYSLSSIAVVIMGAVLGIIVRGGQVLTAFGISCIPSLFVVLSSIVGRNLADKPEHAAACLGVMWGGTAFIYLATFVLTAKFLKR